MRKAKANPFDEGNRQAAEIILGDPEKYPGLPTEWARLWVANHPAEAGRKPARSEQAPPAKLRTRAATEGELS